MTEQLIKVPDIGGAEGAEVVEVLVAPGETIELEQSLIVVESDKASMEIPAPLAGKVMELRVAVGDAVSEGDVIVVLATDASLEGDHSAAPLSSDVLLAEPSQSQAKEEQIAEAPQTEEEIATHMPKESEHASVIDVAIPDLGGDQGADLVEILLPVGTAVEEGDSLVLLESDKASLEVPAPAAGTITEWLVELGSAVQEGMLIARLTTRTPVNAAAEAPAAGAAGVHPEAGRDPTSASPLGTSPQATSAQQAAPAPAPVIEAGEGVSPASSQSAVAHANLADAELVYAGPAVRKLAREFGVSLSTVNGTGARGRILKDDLQQFVAQSLAGKQRSAAPSLPTVPEQDYGRFGAIESVSRSRIDKVTATNMVRSWLNAPHVTQFDDADISELERFRQQLKSEANQRGVRVTPLPFILKACAVALRDHPKLKSSLADNGDTLIIKHYCHIGIAVDTPAGLVVPVIRDVDKKSIWELAAEVSAVAEKAREKKLKPEDMQGGAFTVSSLGAMGGKGFTPIINAPEVAILGVGRAAVQPVWDGEVFRPHTLLPLALSYDHRVVNGGDGGRFLTALTALLADVKRMVL